MRAYLAITTLLLIGIYGAGYAWPDTEAYIADKCRVSNGEWAVLINNEYYRCWRVGTLK